MRCEDVQDRLPEYVSGGLPDDDRARVDAHLGQGCQVCAAECTAIGQAVALLAESLSPVAPPPALRQRVLDQVEDGVATPLLRPCGGGRTERPARTDYSPYLITAVCAALLGVMVSQYFDTGVGNRPDAAAQASDEAGMREWRRRVDAARREFGPPRAQLTGMPTESGDPALQAVVFFDPLAKQMHVLVSGLQQTTGGATLWAWFRDDAGRALFGGPLESLGGSQAAGVVDAPAGVDQAHDVLFTTEQAGRPAAPSGPAVGSVQISRGS